MKNSTDKPMGMTRLLAFDGDDLIVMSAHLEGAKILRANMAYLPQEKRFALVAERRDANNPSKTHLKGLHFEHVEHVMTAQFPGELDGEPLILIGMTFEITQSPSGIVVLLFEGDRAIRLNVECLEARMSDLPIMRDEKV